MLGHTALHNVFAVRDTFVQSIYNLDGRTMLLGCQDGRVFRAQTHSARLAPAALQMGQMNIWDMIGLPNNLCILSYSDLVINCFDIQVRLSQVL